jgi:tripartite ATP-independent transporter DctM subunit
MLGMMMLFFLLGIPVAISIGLASTIGIHFFTPFPLKLLAQQAFVALDKFPLAAIPFFILAGNIMAAGDISNRLVALAQSLVGGLRGGLASTCVLTCMFFAAVSGSGIATTFAIGTILIPAMARAGYPKHFAAALQATSAELGVIIPPSIPMILFGVAANISIGEIFIAGVGPGILIGLTLILTSYVWCRIKGYDQLPSNDHLPPLVALKKASLALMMPLIILGGIYGGIFTPTEASVAAVFYALIVSVCIYRSLTLAQLWKTFRSSAVSSSVVMLILAMAGVFSFILTRAGLPDMLGSWIAEHFHNKWTFLLAVNTALFCIGMFIDAGASILVLAPILTPVAVTFGVDPVHFAIIMVVNLALGMVTPPFGVNLFAACAVANEPLLKVARPLLVFVGAVVVCLMLITYIPQISLILRDLVYR